MVSAQILNMIHKRLLQLTISEQPDHAKPFGGKNILLFGDLFQIKPVNGKWIFEQLQPTDPYH